MKTAYSIVAALVISCCVITSLTACSGGSDGGGGSGGGAAGGIAGVYTSVDNDEIKIEFKSGGAVVMSMGDEKGQPGTYTVEGEKIIVNFGGQLTTFIRDGDCIKDLQNLFGQMCKGGKAGDSANVSTRTPPPTAGTWVATNEDGEFIIEFKSGSALAMTMKPSAAVPNARPETIDGTFTIEDDTIFITLSNSTPVVLKWVNGTYESTAFGLPMKFTKK